MMTDADLSGPQGHSDALARSGQQCTNKLARFVPTVGHIHPFSPTWRGYQRGTYYWGKVMKGDLLQEVYTDPFYASAGSVDLGLWIMFIVQHE